MFQLRCTSTVRGLIATLTTRRADWLFTDWHPCHRLHIELGGPCATAAGGAARGAEAVQARGACQHGLCFCWVVAAAAATAAAAAADDDDDDDDDDSGGATKRTVSRRGGLTRACVFCVRRPPSVAPTWDPPTHGWRGRCTRSPRCRRNCESSSRPRPTWRWRSGSRGRRSGWSTQVRTMLTGTIGHRGIMHATE
eukprot:COSAG01_NODE_3360_length_6201_cov_1.731727_3_plen_195_part_00